MVLTVSQWKQFGDKKALERNQVATKMAPRETEQSAKINARRECARKSVKTAPPAAESEPNHGSAHRDPQQRSLTRPHPTLRKDARPRRPCDPEADLRGERRVNLRHQETHVMETIT